MSRGLYVGKFAPLHKGHTSIIDQALVECEEVTVFVYNSAEFDAANPKLDKTLRGHWVKRMYPEVDVVLGYNPPADRPGYVGDSEHAKYILRHLDYDIDFVYGAEEWVDNFALAMGAESRRNKRDGRGISATKIRDNPAEYAWYMSPEIRDWMLTHYGGVNGLRI